MSMRSQLEEALLPALREVFPEASGEDILLMGRRADICCPLPRKYGIDIPESMVYNIMDGVHVGGMPLLSGADFVDGFINFNLEEDALRLFAEQAASKASLLLPDGFELGLNAGAVRAGLLHASRTAGEGLPTVPSDEAARRALRCALAADSQSAVNVALRLAEETLRRNRKHRFLSETTALAMASAFEIH
ncbi:MAG: hypothetical protein IKG85_11085 [Clostridia bacterium]|nr:hypothetical protein [Clostridia bacterium]